MADTETVVVPAVPTEIAIPDFEVKGCIGEGAFGRVYLALSKATGRYRAVKVVHRSRFRSDHPYDTEFAGLKRFEEVSREHEGFVDILHVTRDDQAGYFCYVMEVADDLESAQQIDAAHYVPRTLAKELERRGRLPPSECVRVGLALTAALAELHRRDLVHRDVNPRNIVFIRGAPKLADVGLVTEAHDKPNTLIGTPDFMDPEVQGTPAGDLYSFGKILYAMATGLHPRQCPDLPVDWNKSPDLPVLRELEAIWRKACQDNRTNRYADAAEIYKELLALQAGASVLRLKRFERALGLLRRYGFLLVILLLTLGIGLYIRARQQSQAAEIRQRKVGSFVANGNHALDGADLLGALSWFAEAWQLDSQRENDLIHRIRLGSVTNQAPALVQMWFQDRQVKEAFFAGQENQVLMSDSSGRWQVYDLTSGQPLYKPFGMGLGLPHELVSFCNRTATAVTSANTNRIWVWDYQSGAKLREIERPGEVITLAAISPDGRWIAAAEARTNSEENLLLWRTDTHAVDPVVLGRHPEGTHALKFSPDSRLLLSTGYDMQARIWDVEARQLMSTFTNHQNLVYSGSFSPDSRLVVTPSLDRSARIWEARTAKELARFTHDDAVWAAEFNSDGTRLVTAGLDFTVRIWNPATQTSLQVLRHNSKVLRAAFSPQDRYLLTSCFDDTVRVWRLPNPPPATPTNGLLTLGGTLTILRTNAGWSLFDQSGTVVRALDLTDQTGVSFWFAPDDRFFVATCPVDSTETSDLRAQMFDAQTTKASRRSISVPRSWSELIVSAGGRWVFAFNTEAGAVWDTISGQRVALMSNGCQRASFSPDARLLAVGRANQVEVLDLEKGSARLARWSHPTNSEVSGIEWDAASRRLITSCWDDTFTPLESQAWVARTGEPAGRPLEHLDGVLYAAFSHDGRRAITCGEDFMAILWDPTTGRQLSPPLRHRDQVFYAAFNEDDSLVATAAAHAEVADAMVVAVWSVETGEPLTSLALPSALRRQRTSIRFTPDNKELIIRNGLEQSFRWVLPFYTRPLQDLLLDVQLRSARQTDSTESLMPHSKETLRAIYQQLRSVYPEDFSLQPE